MTGATSTKPLPAVTPRHQPDEMQQTTPGDMHASPRAPTGQQRVEPSLGEVPQHPAASPAYDQLHGISSSYGEGYGQYPSSSGGKSSRIMLMASIFVIGAAVGVSTAWWFNRPAAGTAVSAVEPAHRVAMPKELQKSQRPPVRGISPSELPYDGGTPPPVSVESEPTKPVASTLVNASETRSSGGGNAAVPDMDGVTPVLPPQIRVQEPRKETLSATAVSESKPPARVKAPPRTEAIVTAAPKSRTPAKTAKDREIERIRQQADEELKKKTERGRAIEEARARPRRTTSTRQNAPQAALAMHTMVAKCDRASNFIRREQCKWRLCNGIWGKNGCPSYPPHPSSY